MTPSDPELPDGDYPGFDDLIVFVSWDPKVALACRSPGFSSERFSASGELFAYLKLEHAAVPREQLADWRGDIEEALDARLTELGVGCTIGGGSGVRYAYIDLALVDVPRAIAAVREVMANRAHVSDRSWLQFYDPELAQEWIGLRQQSPPPVRSAEGG